MKITEMDIKKLWGKAAGHCCFTNCETDCIHVLESSQDSVVIGEMAHVIARNATGPRGKEDHVEDNSYDNLILLCPTHHTLVDKAPDSYPVDKLLAMKKAMEERVSKMWNDTKVFSSVEDMCQAIAKLLIRNKSVWKEYGPESELAQRDPFSNMATYWDLQKLSVIVPNNKKIISIIEANQNLFDIKFYSVAVEFIEHANAFEQNCYDRIDHAKRFPLAFEKEVFSYVR